jgi:dTDP-L-rhamnose 4-epimerase
MDFKIKMESGSVSNVLIVGGAGFIGSGVAKALLQKGCSVRILDNFSSQVHGQKNLKPELAGKVELLFGDVRDRSLLERAVDKIDVIIHLAADTGTGQSMYEIARYFEVNVQATANLLHLVQNHSCASQVRTMVVASSRAVYGEGPYRCRIHGVVYPTGRSSARMEAGQFEPVCPVCEEPISLLAVAEGTPFSPTSIYGLTKQVQEQSVLMVARARGLNGFGLRYQNVYGPGQSLTNPYTGILAIFANLARQGQPIDIYEDGKESRDFVYLEDAVEATVRAALYPGVYVGALNVGSGEATSVWQVADAIVQFFKSSSVISVSGSFRVGDIRHSVADLGEVQRILGYAPLVQFAEGLPRFLEWVESQQLEDHYACQRAAEELAAKGLMQKRKVT